MENCCRSRDTEEANLNSSYLYELDEIRIPANSNFYHTSVLSLGCLIVTMQISYHVTNHPQFQ